MAGWRAARNRGVAKLHMICLPDNLRMRHIAQKYRASLILTTDEVDGWLDPARPDHLSLLREWLVDAAGVMTYLMNLWPPARGIADERRGPFRLTSRPLKLGYSSEKGDFGWEKGRFVRKTTYFLQRL